MKYKIELELPESKLALAMEFLRSLSFVKNVKAVAPNEVTNEKIRSGIEAYETGLVKPIPASLAELKELLHA